MTEQEKEAYAHGKADGWIEAQMTVQIEMSEKMVQEIMDEWQHQHPGADLDRLSAKEFADRMLVKIKATAKLVPDPTAN